MAQVLLRKNDIHGAGELISESLKRATNLGLKKREGCFLRLLGEVQTRKNDLEPATKNIHEAIRVLKDVGNPRKIWEAHAALAVAYDKLGRHADARKHLRVAAEAIEKQAMGLSDKNLRECFISATPVHAILHKSEK